MTTDMPTSPSKRAAGLAEIVREQIKPFCTESDDHDYPQHNCRKCAEMEERLVVALAPHIAAERERDANLLAQIQRVPHTKQITQTMAGGGLGGQVMFIKSADCPCTEDCVRCRLAAILGGGDEWHEERFVTDAKKFASRTSLKSKHGK